ncbi:hypothetical protein M0805_002158 [Coniferiporia weirii]|nr:hypothetical protein M0805_002158 [Coniferiporia weirii]
MSYGLEELVDDVLIHILSVLPVCDLLSVRQTSKRMEMLSHVRDVWFRVFKREVVELGRPIPGYSFFITPRLLSLFGFSEDDFPALLNSTQGNDCLEFIESSDLEARTMHALRLDKRWKSTATGLRSEVVTVGAPAASRSYAFQTLEAIREVFLLPGGRYVVTVHQDRLCCWDLGFPRAFQQGQDKDVRKSRAARCVGEWVVPSNATHSTIITDASEHSNWQSDSSVRFAIFPDGEPSWGESNCLISRVCTVLSARYDPLRSPGIISFGAQGSPFNSPVPAFSDEGSLALPDVLPTPVYSRRPNEPALPEEYGPHRFANGKLGSLLHMHNNLLFFASFIPPAPIAEEADAESGTLARYAGIEVMDWTSGSAAAKSALLEYPDPQLGEFVGVHVYDSAEHILVVWQNCVGLYPIPRFSPAPEMPCGSTSESPRADGSSTNAVPERVVLMPTTIFGLSEAVERPVAFSTCKAPASEIDAWKSSGYPRPLTILSRSRRHPQLTVQSVLTAVPAPPAAPFAPDASGSTELRFRLTRIPAPTPHYFVPPGNAGSGGVCALALGASGRGLRADAGGAMYRCAPTDVVLPCFMGAGGWRASTAVGVSGADALGLVSTVDFWPYHRVDDVPNATMGQEGSEGGRLVVRFDEGMGRAVVARVPVPSAEGTDVAGNASTITVLDFA